MSKSDAELRLSSLEMKLERRGLGMCRGGTVDILDVKDGAAWQEEKRDYREDSWMSWMKPRLV